MLPFHGAACGRASSRALVAKFCCRQLRHTRVDCGCSRSGLLVVFAQSSPGMSVVVWF